MQELSAPEIQKLLLFGSAAFVGMVFGYYRRWAWGKEDIKLSRYMFGGPHAIGRAVTTLLMLCAGAGGLQYLESLSLMQIIVAGGGIGIGLLVPQTVDNKRRKMMRYPQEQIKQKTVSLREIITDLGARLEDLQKKAITQEVELDIKSSTYLTETSCLSRKNAELQAALKTAKEYARSCERKSEASIMLMMVSCIAMLVMTTYFLIQLI